MSRHHRPRKPFDWLGERKHRRGALELIRQGIREGWLDGNEQSDRRDRLVATLCGLLDIEYLPTAEVISLCRTFFAMTRSDLDSELAALKAERAKFSRQGRHLSRVCPARSAVSPPSPPEGVFLRGIGPTPATQEPLSGVGCGNLAALGSKFTAPYYQSPSPGSIRYDGPGWFGASPPARMRSNPLLSIPGGVALDQAGAAEPAPVRGPVNHSDVSLFCILTARHWH